jgi:hypothetical protein
MIPILRIYLPVLLCAALAGCARPAPVHKRATKKWTVGTPIVTYWAGPPMTDAAAQQMAEGGWNVVWCGEKELDVAQRHGLRAQLHDGLISPASLEDQTQRAKLDELINRVRSHPALYCYFITDEPNATNFPSLGKLVAYLRERDPEHLAYINLFPTYASNEQLGNKGDTVTAYRQHLEQFISGVRPDLLSYDHYQFAVKGDRPDYFLNLALVRDAAQKCQLPFLNIVQACTWDASMRVPTPKEMPYLVYTTLAYGAQGISYYVYSCGGHTGMVATAEGKPTEIYHALKPLNHEFVRVATELQPLKSLGVYHCGMLPPGTEPLSKDAVFQLDPPMAEMKYEELKPVKGVLIGFFGRSKGEKQHPSHVLVVNLDYTAEAMIGLKGPRQLELFDAATGEWSKSPGKRVELRLPPGTGKLVRVKR